MEKQDKGEMYEFNTYKHKHTNLKTFRVQQDDDNVQTKSKIFYLKKYFALSGMW